MTLSLKGGLLAAAVASTLLLPSIGAAQTRCEQQAHDKKVAGTVIGGVLGALAGNAIGRGGGRTGGTIIGGVAGAAVGNNLARTHCPDGYAEVSDPNYDPNAAPPPPPPPPPPGDYQQGYAAPPPGDYQQGYAAPPPAEYQQGYSPPPQDETYSSNDMWRGAPTSLQERMDWVQARIERGRDAGRLNPREVEYGQRELLDIRRMAKELRERDGGYLNDGDRSYLQSRLDDLGQRLRWMKHDDDRAGY